MVDDETIRLKMEHWPPQYQGAVIAYARTGNVTSAAKEAGIARPTLSTHINNGYKGVFSPEEWREVVSMLKYRESHLSPQNLSSWLQLQILDKQDWKRLPHEHKVHLVDSTIGLTTKIAEIEAGGQQSASRSRVTVETESLGGDIPRDIIDYAAQTLKDRFHQARYATDPTEDTDDGGGGGPEDTDPEGDQGRPMAEGSSPIRDGE